jgi:hypothetical protein
MKHFETSGFEPVLVGIKWSERYNCYTARIAGWLELAFSYDITAPKDGSERGYRISVAGARLKGRGTSPEHAARITVASAKALLAKALKELEEAK